MKKLLAILLCCMMLVSACAFAEGGELLINNIVVNMIDPTTEEATAIDLTGIDLKLAVGSEGENAGLRVTVGGNGADIASIVAAVNAGKLLLGATGISDVYALDLEETVSAAGVPVDEGMALNLSDEDLMELAAIGQTAMMVIAGSVADAGAEEIEGVLYQNYAIEITEESVDSVLLPALDFVDSHPEIAAMLEVDESLRAAYEASGMKASVSGVFSISEVDLSGSLDLILRDTASGETAALSIAAFGSNIVDEANGVEAMDFTAALAVVDGETEEEILALGATVNSDLATGAFVGMDGYVVVPEGEDYTGLLFGAYSPAMVGEGLWQFYLMDYAQTTAFEVICGESLGADCFQLVFTSEEASAMFTYEGMDGAGVAGVSIEADGMTVEVLANVAVSEVGAEWLALDAANAVDLMTITDEQMQVLQGEGMSLLLNVVSGLAAANETVAALLGDMM